MKNICNRIFVTGDTHGDFDINKLNKQNFAVQEQLTKDDYLIIVGDFGACWYGGKDIEHTNVGYEIPPRHKSKIGTTEFANIMKNSDNYFVLISRRKLSNIPYSINEIYTLESKRLEKKSNNVTNITTKKYKSLSKEDIEPGMLITEDSGSGYDFFKAFFGENKCISAGGKDKVEVELRKKLKDIDKIYVIVDSAAFGPEVDSIIDLVSVYSEKDIRVYTPESVERPSQNSGSFNPTAFRR